MRKSGVLLIILVSLLGFSWTAYGADYGKLLSKSCYPATYRGHQVQVCYLKYEKADVWTRDGQVYAYRPTTEKERKALKRLSDWSPTEKGLWYTFLGLQAGDVGTTAAATLSGKGYEANPLLGWAFKSSNILGLAVGTAGKGLYCWSVKRSLDKPKAQPTRKPLLGILNAIFLGVVLHNLWVLL